MTFPIAKPATGVTRQVLAETPDMMVVAFRFEAQAEGALHSHPHVQATYVQSGSFTFYLGDESHALARGDSLIIPSGVAHGCLCHESGTLIDTFTPRRDDFL